MPCFGGFCPLPLRLGGHDLSSWQPEQHARMAADVSAMCRTEPLAVLTYTIAATVVTLHAASALWGNGTSVVTSITSPVGGVSVVTFDLSYLDSYERPSQIHIKRAKVTSHTTGAPVTAVALTEPNIVTVRTWSLVPALTDAKVTLAVW